jgi:hypothetical protein
MSKANDDLHPDFQPDSSAPVTRERQIELEGRIHKLETALADRNAPSLTEESEDAVANRVIAKLSAAAGLSQAPDSADRVLVLASRPDDVPPPPKGAVLHPPEAVTDPNHRTWFMMQLLAEFRLALNMYFDPRYRISRTTQFALPGIALLVLFNYFFFAIWFKDIAILSPIAERLIDLLLFVFAYKLLTRELGRYREVLAYLARYGQH